MGVSPRPRLRLPIDSSLGVTHRGWQPGAESERAMVPYLPFAIYIYYTTCYLVYSGTASLDDCTYKHGCMLVCVCGAAKLCENRTGCGRVRRDSYNLIK